MQLREAGGGEASRPRGVAWRGDPMVVRDGRDVRENVGG